MFAKNNTLKSTWGRGQTLPTMASATSSTKEPMAPATNNQSSKRSQAAPCKAGRRWFHQNLRGIARDITNSHRQPLSRLRSLSTTAFEPPNVKQPSWKPSGNIICHRGSILCVGAKCGGSGYVKSSKSPHKYRLRAPSSPTPPCLMSEQHRDAVNTPPSDIVGGFTIYVDLSSGEETTSDDATTFSVVLQRGVNDNQVKLYKSLLPTTPQRPHAIRVCTASGETGLIPAHDILPLK